MRHLTGTRLRERRVLMGIRQGDLARQAGISAPYLNLIEHNRRKVAPDLLERLAAALNTSSSAMSDDVLAGVDGDIVSTLAELAAQRPDGQDPEFVGDLLERFPVWARLMAMTHQRNLDLVRAVEALNDRMSHDPFLPTSLHEVLSAASSIQTTAAILADTEDLEPDWQSRFLANLMQDGRRLAEGTRSLANYLENQGRKDEFGLASPLEEAESWAAGCDWDLRIPAQSEGISTPARALIADWVDRDQADRKACSDHDLTAARATVGEDAFALAEYLGVDPAQVMRRLALAAGRSAGLILCDGSGTLTLRKPIRGFSVPRFGGACPLWPLFAALGHPGMAIVTALRSERDRVTTSDHAPGFQAWAFGHLQPAFGAGGIFELRGASMLLVPTAARSGEAALRVGSSCRVCAVEACRARREPSILHQNQTPVPPAT